MVELHVIQAARKGHNGTISILKGSREPRELAEAFCDAAEAGNIGVIEQLLHDGTSPDSNRKDKSAMILASRKGHQAIIELLLKAEATHTCPDLLPSDHIPLHQAIRNGHLIIAAIY